MAIGLPLPPPHIPRLRPEWRIAGTFFARQTKVLKSGMLRIVSAARILWKRLANATKDPSTPRARARQRLHAQLAIFEQQYEGIIDLLCVSAREGIREDRENEYSRVRTWMFAHYPRIARHIRPHWGCSGTCAVDPFMALFAHPCLGTAINQGDGIESMMQSRMALEAYRAELDAWLV